MTVNYARWVKAQRKSENAPLFDPPLHFSPLPLHFSLTRISVPTILLEFQRQVNKGRSRQFLCIFWVWTDGPRVVCNYQCPDTICTSVSPSLSNQVSKIRGPGHHLGGLPLPSPNVESLVSVRRLVSMPKASKVLRWKEPDSKDQATSSMQWAVTLG